MVLSGGAPREPEHGNWHELTSLPGPPRFLEALFRELCDVDVTPGRCRLISEDTATEGVKLSKFLCGGKKVGFRQSERTVTESSDFPVDVEIETVGLPGIELSWRFKLDYQGQLGHCGFRHGRLAVGFADDAARARFVEIWRLAYDRTPEFKRETDQK